MLTAIARRLLGLPRPRTALELERLWVPLADGVRLATHVLHPDEGGGPTLLIRTPYGVRAFPGAMQLFANLLGEGGYHVVLQDVRGRYESEGRFRPFEQESDDAADTLAWLGRQPWFDGRLGLVGASYLGYAAWTALARSPLPVGALVVLLGTRDLYRSFYTGGAFGLATALEWATGVGEREAEPARRVDAERGLAHRPIRDADRVSLRRSDAFQDWLTHPRRDAYWQPLCPEVPSPPPPSLLIGGWYDFFLEPQLADYRALHDAAAGDPQREPRLVLGAWRHGASASREARGREGRLPAVAMLEIRRFLDRTLRGDDVPAPPQPVRAFVQGEVGWRGFETWPPPTARERSWFLHGDEAGGRLLDAKPGPDDSPTRFKYDPSDPTPGVGSPRLRSGGPADLSEHEKRTDVVCFTGDTLEGGVIACGPVRLALHAASSTPDTDFAARLVDVDRSGTPRLVCEGILRCRWREGGETPTWLEPDVPVELSISLGSTGYRFRPGHRIRLEIGSALYPRFDANPNSQVDPAAATSGDFRVAAQSIFHDAARPSHLVLSLLPDGETAASQNEQARG